MILPLTILLLAAAAPAAAPLTLDLDGDGTAETVTAAARGKNARVEVRSSPSGKVIAHADVPVPAAGASEVSLSAGSLGSAGALIEVVAAGAAGTEECRSIWRFRERSLSRVPVTVRAGPLPDCGERGAWSYGWDGSAPDAPAQYRRERTRETPEGTHHQVESFRYAGFTLEPDPARTRAEIRGLVIPSWYPTRLYQKASLEGLYARYDLSALKRGPRLQIVTDRSDGVFGVRIGPPGAEELLPVTARAPGPEKHDVVLTLGGRTPPVQLRITLAGGAPVPGEAVLSGYSPAFDGFYSGAMHISEGKLRVFETAADELATNGLVGIWTSERGEPMAIALASADPVTLNIRKSKYRVELEGAPEGMDAVALPSGGGPPARGLQLRGPNSFSWIPILCGEPGSSRDCRASGPAEILHRVGARMNAR
ncbi:MAG: hypothetical protein M3S32_08725 [Acidobacteriota bacterium]|nr:hypothetical protein [Acidobacteriota bacterium]